MRAQPWHSGRVGTFGPSYLGLVQWAIAAEAGDELAAMAIQVSASQFFDQTYAGGGMSLETAASWMALMTAQEQRAAPLAINRSIRRLAAAAPELPLGELDERATGAVVPWYREAFAHPERDDPTGRPATSRPPSPRSALRSRSSAAGTTSSCRGCSADHAALQAAGPRPQLTDRPWAHTSPGPGRSGHREGSPGCARTCSTIGG